MLLAHRMAEAFVHAALRRILPPPGRYWPATLCIRSRLGPVSERQILLHEMIHCALCITGIRETPPHGEPFVAELERLGTLGERWAIEQAEQIRATPELDSVTTKEPTP